MELHRSSKCRNWIIFIVIWHLFLLRVRHTITRVVAIWIRGQDIAVVLYRSLLLDLYVKYVVLIIFGLLFDLFSVKLGTSLRKFLNQVATEVFPFVFGSVFGCLHLYTWVNFIIILSTAISQFYLGKYPAHGWRLLDLLALLWFYSVPSFEVSLSSSYHCIFVVCIILLSHIAIVHLFVNTWLLIGRLK